MLEILYITIVYKYAKVQITIIMEFKMTREELKEFNGKDGKPAYIAYKGKVYDVTGSDFWKDGTHIGRFHAGEDLTDSIGMSPHGEANIFRFKEVGALDDGNVAESNQQESGDTIVPDSNAMISELDQKMISRMKWYKKNHPHPKVIHFPIGMLGFAFFAQILSIVLYLINGASISATIVTASGLIATAFSILFTLPAIASGALSFYINYNGFANPILKKKIIGSAVLMVTSVITVFIGYNEITGGNSIWGNLKLLDTVLNYNPVKSIYSLFTLINLGIITYIADHGGKITWPQEKE